MLQLNQTCYNAFEKWYRRCLGSMGLGVLLCRCKVSWTVEDGLHPFMVMISTLCISVSLNFKYIFNDFKFWNQYAVKYYNPYTGLCLLRCSRSQYRQVSYLYFCFHACIAASSGQHAVFLSYHIRTYIHVSILVCAVIYCRFGFP